MEGLDGGEVARSAERCSRRIGGNDEEMDLNGRRIFLAGGTGLAGAGIIESLLEQYPYTKIRASYHLTKPFLYDKLIEYVQADLRSPEDCRRMAAGCDFAVMAAAMTGGAKTVRAEPWQQVTDNTIMDARILQACRLERVRRVVFVSTASVYQEFQGFIREDELDWNQDPPSAYFGVGWAKRYVEKLCRFWYEKAGMEILIARAANLYGPFAKFEPAVSHFIPALIRKAVDRMDPFEVWGDPAVTRDVIFTEDFGRAIVRMLDREDLKFDTFNVGSGIRTTVGEVVECALKIAGHRPGRIAYRADGPTTIRFRALDCSRARTVLDWEPRYSLEEGIRRTAGWWVENRSWWTK